MPEESSYGFTLRNDVRFGDSMATVRAKETLPFDEERCTQERLRTQKGTVAGIANVRIEYIFSADKLQEVVWEKGCFPIDCRCWPFYDPSVRSPFREKLPSFFDFISFIGSKENTPLTKLRAYVDRYGRDPGFNGSPNHLVRTTATILADKLSNLNNGSSCFRREPTIEEHRIVDFGKDEHAQIDLACCCNYTLSPQVYIFVSYKYFTNADLNIFHAQI